MVRFPSKYILTVVQLSLLKNKISEHQTSIKLPYVFACSRTDPEKRQYTGALVGLGYDPTTGYALLPDHDSELVFEVEITQDDIIQVRVELYFEKEA